uniref:Large ribosomal subunit protein mL50 n=1 Tax=Plectus sambesii TaxID=2011161 RepID=A0A914XJU1_9BILA
MHRSAVRCVRLNDFFKNIKALGKKTVDDRAKSLASTSPADSALQRQRLQPALARLRKKEDESFSGKFTEDEYKQDKWDTEEDIDIDSIRARGFLRHRKNYAPPADLDKQFGSLVKRFASDVDSSEDWLNIKLSDKPTLKFKLMYLLEQRLGHAVPNSRLHEMKMVADLRDFYQEPISNVTPYTELARDADAPRNLHVMEHAARFHPEDTEAHHGGVTAFPGAGGKVYGLRNKRLYRQFNPKTAWYDFEDDHFVYDRVDKDSPWNPEVAKKMDRVTGRKNNF